MKGHDDPSSNDDDDDETLNSASNMKRPTIVEDLHMDTEKKKLVNRFSRLFQEMKNGRDNSGELCILLDELKDRGTFDGEECQKLYAIKDIYNKSSYLYC